MHLLMSNFSVRHRLQRFPLQKFGDTWAMTDQEILNSELFSFKFQICFESAVQLTYVNVVTHHVYIYIYIYIYISSQRNSGNRTSEDALAFFFFGLHLILGVNSMSEDMKTLLLVFTDIFSENV